MMVGMLDYRWNHIEPLTDNERSIDLGSLKPLYETWRASKARLQESSPANFKDFSERLIRRLSIETGILEHLYDLDTGTTEALVTHGFVEDLVSHSSTDIEPERLIDILRDQESAIQLMMDCVAGKREFNTWTIHELQAILTSHQETTNAVDQFGKRFEIPLLKAKYKERPNNPRRPDGRMHEYCPPEHVASEMDNLLAWFYDYSEEDPVIVATWLHHRFTQIHPYQDGNGRVARALCTFVLLRSELLPLVVDRQMRVGYIKALETADNGDLEPLASLFAALERRAIMQALSVDADREIATQQSLTEAVIENLAQKFGKRRVAQLAELRTVNDLAMVLRQRAHEIIESTFNQLRVTLAQVAQAAVRVEAGGPDHDNAHWYRFEVVQSANEARTFANFTENHYFVKASIRADDERLVFVTSFHHTGRELSGIMEVTAFRQLESYENSEERERVSQAFSLCSLEPFVFTYQTKEVDIARSFERWLDAALAVAIQEYGDRV